MDEKPKEIVKITETTGIDVIQIHGNEPPEMCNLSRRVIKAIRVKSLESLDPLIYYRDVVSVFLLDTFTPNVFGGTGQIFNWDIAVEAKEFGRIILSGGLTPDNISSAVTRVRPYGVDVSSGVKEGGKQSMARISAFVKAAKNIR